MFLAGNKDMLKNLNVHAVIDNIKSWITRFNQYHEKMQLNQF